MVRLELFANRSVEDQIMDQLNLINCHHFTKIPVAMGEGKHEPKQGDAIWPEMNFILIIYCQEDEVPTIKLAIEAVKVKFKEEGIRLFRVPADLVT
ncbi:MAG: PG0541 family transporter-associated protein [Spirochaetia bacterium]